MQELHQLRFKTSVFTLFHFNMYDKDRLKQNSWLPNKKTKYFYINCTHHNFLIKS